MVQNIIDPLTRQLMAYRHQALAAPTMLDDGTLAPSHVAGVLDVHFVNPVPVDCEDNNM